MQGLPRLSRSIQHPCSLTYSKGVALITSLIILLIMTLLGFAAIQTTIMEERMAGNLHNKDLSFQAAEAALREGENTIAPLTAVQQPNAVSSCSGTDCVFKANSLTSDFASQSHSWWQSKGREYGSDGTHEITSSESDPRYVIEEFAFVSDSLVLPQSATTSGGTYYYRISAEGTGGNDKATSVLQSTVAKRY